jgi:hypothetical protein
MCCKESNGLMDINTACSQPFVTFSNTDCHSQNGTCQPCNSDGTCRHVGEWFCLYGIGGEVESNAIVWSNHLCCHPNPHPNPIPNTNGLMDINTNCNTTFFNFSNFGCYSQNGTCQRCNPDKTCQTPH